jgi:hypothetical protein
MGYVVADGTSPATAGSDTASLTLGAGTAGSMKPITAWSTTTASVANATLTTLYTFGTGTQHEGIYWLNGWSPNLNYSTTTLPQYWSGIIAVSSANVQVGSMSTISMTVSKQTSTTIQFTHTSPEGAKTFYWEMFKVI